MPPLCGTRIRKVSGCTCDARVTWADITPTSSLLQSPAAKASTVQPAGSALLHRAGAMRTECFTAGRLSVLEQEHPGEWDEIPHTFHEVTMYYPMRATISGKYKYIVNFANGLAFPFASDLYASATWQVCSAATTGFTANAK